MTAPQKRQRTALEVLAIVVLVAVAIAGLVGMCLMIFFVIAISQWGNNK